MLHVVFVTLLIVTVTLCTTSTNAQVFSVVPESTTANIGRDVTFRCRHPSAETIRWRVNGDLISGNNPPPNITPSTTRDESHNYLVSTLTIVARLEYNQTMVVCVARFDDGSPDETTEAALLTVVDEADVFRVPSMPPCSFPVAPSEQVVPVMTPATFQCQPMCHNASITTAWRVNRTSLNQLRNSQNITTTEYGSDENGRIGALTITALSEFNMTIFECVIFFFGDSESLSQTSPPVILWIQGRLPAVSNLRRNPSNFSITWTPPYSLNLTDIEQDIAYCVYIYNITCGKEDPLIHNCTITEPKYSSPLILQRADLFQIAIVPRSNKQGSVMGVKHVIREKYIHVIGSAISAVVRITSNSGLVEAQILLDLTLLGGNIAPDSFVISLESVNDRSSRNFSASTIKLTSEVAILHLSDLPYGKLWYCTIYADRCGGTSISDITTLSTFDVTNANVSANSTDGKVKVSCRFIEGSEAAGILIIAYSTSNPSDIHYQVIPRNGQQSVETVLSCLPGETYNVLLFVISKDGLPLSFPATQVFPTSVNHRTESNLSTKGCVENEAIMSNVYQQGDSVCVECYFTNKNDSCVVIIHQNISQLNSTKESLNISFIEQIKRTNDSEKGRKCIPGINIYEYQVGVIPLILYQTPGSLSTKDSESNTLYYIIAGSATLVCVIMVLLRTVPCIIGWCICQRCQRSKGSPSMPPQQVHQNVPSSTTVKNPTESGEPPILDSEHSVPLPTPAVHVINNDDTEHARNVGTHELSGMKEPTTQFLELPRHPSNRDSGISTTPMEGTTNNVTPIMSQRGSNVHNQAAGPTLDKLALDEKLRDLNHPQAAQNCDKYEKDTDFSITDSQL